MPCVKGWKHINPPKEKKKLQQSTQGEQTSGQGQNQKKLKKPQQATGNQPMTGNEQATGGQAQPNKKKKLIQQGQAQPGQTKQGQPSEQMTTGATGKLA